MIRPELAIASSAIREIGCRRTPPLPGWGAGIRWELGTGRLDRNVGADDRRCLFEPVGLVGLCRMGGGKGSPVRNQAQRATMAATSASTWFSAAGREFGSIANAGQ
ncbi:hypothetical protein F4560_003187 [Saccharothrix ecbatanensis]|uniref:Uncharacterized protein n=1 Tax=Saccharothrix ecbatanensis TaxID=1105145 RepID=A0A7W9HJF3_9PSEU|nr:hypothetical protein [Saccharothrix ecbatanensis]MBB5803419.1 hypothetical protein [Saccharothrix ecbatanensis]